MEDLTDDGRPPKLGSLPELSGQSGFTPVDESIPKFPIKKAVWGDGERKANEIRLIYQRDRLYGFTTHELENLDVISTRPLRPSNLPDRIHQLFRRDLWESVPPSEFVVDTLYPLPKGLTGDCM